MENNKAKANSIIEAAANAPIEQEKELQQFLDRLMQLRISADDEFPPEQCLLEIGGVGFFAKGDIHAIKAKQKSGKTNAISIMVAAILSGKWGPLTAALPNAKVLVIDTEQKEADTQMVYNRTLALAGHPKQDDFDRFQAYHLRSLNSGEKLKALEVLIRMMRPDIVFVDGVVDLMSDFNEVVDSKSIVERLMQLCTPEVSGCEPAIVCVLHTNKATDDHNMRGHLGTMLAQKSGTVLEVDKKENIFTITNTDARHKVVPQWSYTFDEHDQIVDASALSLAKAEEAKKNREEKQAQKSEETKNQRKAALIQIIQANGGAIQRNVLISLLMEKLGKGVTTADNVISDNIKDGTIAIDEKKLVTINSPNGQIGLPSEAAQR